MTSTLAAAPPVVRFPGPPAVPGSATRPVPGHNRWHPDIPAVAEVITGGSVRLECEGGVPGEDPVLCGPLVVVGAEPGDVIVVDVMGVGRSDGVYAPFGHPGVIGCAPAAGSPRPLGPAPEGGVLLGHVRPDLPEYGRMAAEAVRGRARGREIGGCGIARLGPASRILLPVHVRGAKLSVGDLHFPARGGDDCRFAGRPGWIDLRVNLTRRGVERFNVTGPLLMTGPA
ncbi:acetamidase/formamidase family protein [Actinomadura viridis]|uniref:acetamidase/formamidase family protein n=1 Tax=Actinomadura viridis TaxID=58110 RepID=UPI0036B4AED0